MPTHTLTHTQLDTPDDKITRAKQQRTQTQTTTRAHKLAHIKKNKKTIAEEFLLSAIHPLAAKTLTSRMK